MSNSRAFLDTTIHIDRKKSGARAAIIGKFLTSYDWKFGTSIGQLEFKATIVQECITIHNELAKAKRFTRARDSLLESSHPQAKLRTHIFNNLIDIWASSHSIGDKEDQELAHDARLNLEIVIPELYNWFVKEAVDSVLSDRIACTRAIEPPFKKKAAFENSMPVCANGKGNKDCSVEQTIRDHGPDLIAKVRPTLKYNADGTPSDSDRQLLRSIAIFEKVISGEENDLNHRGCRSCGDCLMAIEAKGTATHALSTDTKEWERLAAATGMQFVQIKYEEERKGSE